MTKILIGKSNIDLDYPICRPSLDLDFTQEVLDERITFSRGSVGTRVNRNRLIETVPANQPRFDYDPVTGECKGLLIEESRQNLLTYSEDFSNWTAANINVTTNATTSPDGTVTADRIYDNTITNLRWVVKGVSGITAGTTITVSVFVKFDSPNRNFWIQLTDAPSGGPNYSTVRLYPNGTYDLPNPIMFSNTSANVIRYPNGWYRVYITITTSTVTTISVRFILELSTISATNYQGDGNSGLYIWGAQLETGAFPTSYIPTGAATLTRSADTATMEGINFSSWYNQTEGSIVSSCVCGSTGANSADFVILNSSNTSRILGWFNNTTTPLFAITANNNTVYLPFIGGPTNQTNIPIKKAISLADKNMRVYVNGTILTADLGNADVQDYLPTDFNNIRIGVEGITVGYLNGTIKRFTYYPKALKPSQLQLLTA